MKITFNINDFFYKTKEKLTIIQACLKNNVDIPRFCYHEKLSIAGNCRMCLVEDLKQIKPLASCSINVSNGMQIYTNSVKVKKAREAVLSFLLANHPLDCPICDQGGECDLQDQSIIFGSDRGRFYEYKRSVEDKNCGPLIKTIMNRCIHCTRCVRFSSEIGGSSYLGITGRGMKMEIGFYIESMLNNELSGNVIDLCPVGALTSKPFAFSARSWELKSYESLDILDGLGSNIRVDVRGSKILRIIPRINSFVNGDWITDKIRFCYDSVKNQRLYEPLIKVGNSFLKSSWEHVLFYIKNVFINILSLHFKVKANSSFLYSACGDYLDNETLIFLKSLNVKLGNNNMVRKFDIFMNDFREYYSFNKTLKDLPFIDMCLLVGSNNIRLSSPILNSELRQQYRKNKLVVYNIGPSSNFNYFIKSLGNSLCLFNDVLRGLHWVCTKLYASTNPFIILDNNENVLKLILSYSLILSKHTNLLSKNNNYNWGIGTLPHNINFFSKNEFNAFIKSENFSGISRRTNILASKNTIKYLVGYDNFNLFGAPLLENRKGLFIYQGHHGDAGASISDVILPSSLFLEKNSSYTNLFGLTQKTKAAVNAFGNSRDDWKIIAALLNIFNLDNFAFSNITTLKLNRVIDYFSPFISANAANFSYLSLDALKQNKNTRSYYCLSGFAQSALIFNSIFTKYFEVGVISRYSKVLTLCSKKFKTKNFNFSSF